MVNTILKEADLFCPNSVRINFTIYRTHTVSVLNIRINSNYLRLTWSPFKLADLPNRNIRQSRVNEHRGTFTSGTSIKQRSKIVNPRLAFGHWKVDTVLSGRKVSRVCLVTFFERKTRLIWAIKPLIAHF